MLLKLKTETFGNCRNFEQFCKDKTNNKNKNDFFNG